MKSIQTDQYNNWNYWVSEINFGVSISVKCVLSVLGCVRNFVLCGYVGVGGDAIRFVYHQADFLAGGMKSGQLRGIDRFSELEIQFDIKVGVAESFTSKNFANSNRQMLYISQHRRLQRWRRREMVCCNFFEFRLRVRGNVEKQPVYFWCVEYIVLSSLVSR